VWWKSATTSPSSASGALSLYDGLLFVHVLAAAAWFGAALLSLVLVELAARAREIAWVVRLGEFDEKVAKLLFIPSSLVVLATGFALVFDGPWSFTGDGWVIVGIALLVAIFVLGVALIVPAGQKLTALAASGAPETELDGHLRKLRTLSSIDVALLAAAIFFMTTKPF
jgi:uncharacterized membrane protein